MAKRKTQITAIKVLSEMDAQQRRLDSPSIPPAYIIGSNYAEKNANHVERNIERFAGIVGFMAERTKVQGRMMEAKFKDTPMGRLQTSKGGFVTSTGKKGSSDMKLVINGKAIACEVKFGKDTQKEAQKDYQAKYEASGGTYIIVKSFEDFLIWYVNEYGRPKQLQLAIDSLK